MATKPWSPWYTEITDLQGRKTDSLQCNLCRRIFARRLERQLSHLGYEVLLGKRNSGVGLCTKLTTRIHNLFKKCRGQYPKHNGELLSEYCPTPSLNFASSSEHSTPMSTGGDSCVGSSQAPPLISPTTMVEPTPAFYNSTEQGSVGGTFPKSVRQSVIEEGFQEVERRELDKLWAKFFYEANVPFAVARNAAFKEAVAKTASFRKPYVPPSYHDIRTRLLGQAKVDLETQLDSRLGESVRKFGGTLSLDGWTSMSSRPLCNAMLVSPAGELFLGAIDTTGNEKTATYLASILLKYIEQVGPHNIVQVCTDNASAMLSASRLVVEKHPHIFIQGCATHAMNLLLEDWGKATWIKETLEKAKLLVKFIKNRHMPLALFRKHEAKFSLLMPGKTRFACNFIMIDRLLKVKESLEQTVVDPEWQAYSSKKSLPARDRVVISRSIKRVVLDEHFWERCTNFREMVAPVVYALREFDAKEPCTGKALHIIRELEKHVLALHKEPFCLDKDLAAIAREDFYARKRMMTTDLHCAGALLNPYLLHDKELADDQDVTTACKRVLQRLCTPETYPDVVKEFIAFRHKAVPFHDMLDPKDQKCSPYAWWDFEGACGKLLAPIAKRILAQTVSSSSCERNWSSYSFVHDKKRNRLLPGRADDLVFVYTNSKLLANAKLTDEKRWYAENVDLEDPQPRESDDPEYYHDSSSGAIPDLEAMHLDDDIAWSPPLTIDNVHDVPINEYDFIDDDVLVEKEDDLLPIARYLNGDGMVNSDNILGHGPTPITEDTVILGEKTMGGGTKGITTTPSHVTEKKVSLSKDEPSLHGRASRSLFRTVVTKVTTTNEKSSHGLVSLSKQVRPRTPQGQSDGISSDGDVPISKLFSHHVEVRGGSGLQPKPPTNGTRKRKAPMHPFVRSKPRNPIDVIETCKRFKTIQTKSIKRRIKQEVTTDYEDDPSGSSGAEIKGDSDYELPTDVNE